MRIKRHRHPANVQLHDNASRSHIAVDRFVSYFGSLRYIMWQTVVVIIWIAINLIAYAYRWDPYPFILLNLVFSTQASYAAPLILMAQNRQTEHDRISAEHSYHVGEQTQKLLRAMYGMLCGQLPDDQQD
jgi:uncharacterized membrane protein